MFWKITVRTSTSRTSNNDAHCRWRLITNSRADDARTATSMTSNKVDPASMIQQVGRSMHEPPFVAAHLICASTCDDQWTQLKLESKLKLRRMSHVSEKETCTFKLRADPSLATRDRKWSRISGRKKILHPSLEFAEASRFGLCRWVFFQFLAAKTSKR